MAKYLIFNTTKEVAEANGRWLYELYRKKELSNEKEKRKNPKKYTAWDFGIELEDGTFLCDIPYKYKEVFGGTEIDIEKPTPKKEGEKQ